MIKHTNPKTVFKLSALLDVGAEVEIAPEQIVRLRPINLQEVIQLFTEEADHFLTLYALSLEGQFEIKGMTKILLAAPELVAKIIAFASDEPDQVEAVQKRMPATAQLIALREIIKMSVPDPKKGRELLSEVTALAQKLQDKGGVPEPKPETVLSLS